MGEDHPRSSKPTTEVKVNDLTAGDVAREGASLGKDVIKTTLVWTLAGFLTKAVRDVVKRGVGK